ncbi:hypothetical protein ABD76_06790 [Paenibacillus dendritiformis]|uniref:SGNH/GDSL hydrolase family protein n=1 Tax=Paenibacillus dendritiformis TaxID=130049 RepID=UPI0018CCF8A9|nr:SGNH/GDSL hydrolase family protein [Paenibacillus dendritiformis]MBG9792223.1 hypothetical protein [Paenibacillus dendritiformis]
MFWSRPLLWLFRRSEEGGWRPSFLTGQHGLKIAVLLCYMVVAPLLLSQAGTENTRATWLWETQWMAEAPADIVSFAQAQRINLIYLQIDQEREAEAYRRFIRMAREAGIQVHALEGKPEWARPDRREEGVGFIRWVRDYNAAVPEEERFGGVHFDVEPYLLPGWKEEQARVVKEWTDSMDRWIREAREAGLFIAADVPFWLDKIPAPGEDVSMSVWVQERFDAITIMAYRNHVNAIYDVAAADLSIGERLNRPVLVGVELGQTDEGESVSFHGQPEHYFDYHLRAVEQQGGGHPSFAGVAIHHLRAWYDKVYGAE